MIRALAGVVCAAALLFGGHAAAYEKTSEHEALKIYEWTVLVSPSVNARPSLKQTMLRNLDAQLAKIRSSIRPEAMRQVVKARIWLDVTSRGNDGHHVIGQYFPSRTWLRTNGMNPDKYQGVQLNALFAKDGTQGTVVFHELAHVYHDRRIKNSNRIQRMWEAAWLAHPDGFDNCGRKTQAYAFRDPGEFFATYSQAYLSRNCAFPYDRATIQRIDPKMLAFLQKIWGPLR
ncbi:putative metallopeptidase [Candidatus Rhodobacter oscarellae]|uniref:Putative metallopeptidase n=1 Tax=Candidatus Rhodobacter oscarellae TaxID=1675527 RepID=A0A0J9E438_9RHOB|nr:hypothetical protein [Candidatus Rhodobacter lobularis]KMW57482.1 putative metallopeptidase [Candidatus Rhodobacter lobularis]